VTVGVLTYRNRCGREILQTREFTLVLGGGGIKGLAHLGVLTALEEAGVRPVEIVGSSIGALIGASWCAGVSISELQSVAVGIRRRDVLRMASTEVAFKRMQAPALYRREPLERLIRGLVGDITFEDLKVPFMVNTVDLNSGQQVLWGTPGFTDVQIADAVYASCALPGFLPPQEIQGRYFVDGAVVENLPLGVAAARKRDFVLAVDVGSNTVVPAEIHSEGIAAVYSRVIEIAIQTMRDQALQQWDRPPLILLEPPVEHLGMFAFRHAREFIDAGYRSTKSILAELDNLPASDASGIFPRRAVNVRIDRERCVGCGLCLIYGGADMFAIDDAGKAIVKQPEQIWSPADGGFVRQCPTYAIAAREVKTANSEASIGRIRRWSGHVKRLLLDRGDVDQENG
jgi:NTE family protein